MIFNPRTHSFLLLAFLLGLIPRAEASAIVGTVMNLSNHQLASGDEVIWYHVDQTMHEVSRTRSDAHGTFRFENWDGHSYIVAVVHQKISYHTKQLSGTNPVEISVYDGVPRLARVKEISDTVFPQPAGNRLQVSEFFVVVNSSNPPQTLSGNQSFKFQLPRGAVLDSAAVQPPGTLPFPINAIPCGAPNEYCIDSPMRPGTTKIRAHYQLPYARTISITQRSLRPVGEVAFMIPPALRFEAKTPEMFVSRGEQDGLSVYVANNVGSGQPMAFALSTADLSGAGESATASPGPLLDTSLTRAMPAILNTTPRLHPDRQPWTIFVVVLVTTGLAAIAFRKVRRSATWRGATR